MANEPSTTITGNLTADPELRFTPSGTAVANFTIAQTPRTYDPADKEWKDGETLFIRCTAWRDSAEHAAESLRKGSRVIAEGTLKARRFETKEGEKRSTIELEVEELGLSLRYAPAQERPRPTGSGRAAAPDDLRSDDPFAAPAH